MGCRSPCQCRRPINVMWAEEHRLLVVAMAIIKKQDYIYSILFIKDNILPGNFSEYYFLHFVNYLSRR